jgi:hypothetical protein
VAANWQYGFSPFTTITGYGSSETIGTGNGSTTTFNYTVTFFPILPVSGGGTVLISLSGSQIVADVNTGGTTGTFTWASPGTGGTGTVNYQTGAISLTFGTAPSASAPITCTYYASTINTTPSNNDDVAFNMKQTFKQAGWTCTKSGEGTGGTFSLTADLITVRGNTLGAFGYTDGGTGGGAWFVLESPDTKHYILFQRSTTAANAGFWYVGYSKVGFTGTANGAISATVAPTAADTPLAWGLFGHPASGTTVAYVDFFVQTAGNYHSQFAADANAPYGAYEFSFVKSTLAIVNGFFFDSLAAGSYMSADTDPWIIYMQQNTSTWSQVSMTATNFLSSVNGVLSNDWQIVNWSLNVTYNYNPYTGKIDLLPQFYYASSSSQYLTYKGQSYYFKYLTTGSAVQLLSQTTLNDTVTIGWWAFPWNGLGLLTG